MSSGDRRVLAERAGAALEGAAPQDVLRWAAEQFGDRFALTSSMADAVLTTLAAEAIPGAEVIFLDTGYHFPQTLATRDRVAAELDVSVVNVRPKLSVAEQNQTYGQSLYASDPDRCCAMRKVEPLDRVLRGYDAWASGVRRDESPSRANTKVVGWDAKREMVKVNPLACWTQAQVDEYAAARGVIMNPLVELGFTSIGCAPCTERPVPGSDSRSGRWSGTEKTECGLHV
ncbi:MAG: phosphoadenosine phosphosulfate reductase [Actinomycetia bacterium]|jgi:phosphoadenosine phosphosulfate reductase|nr:phosphoadenosine phosphosulfate reductase [Actinomycetes bacterium]MDQ1651963.1 phosphoadenosine phosphosulfate reductase [Cryptosporangiaceae bacterium]MDQ1655825.1 phosphoadenosine phosphosulfate reductase [Cryptosporangiaceae bacterium]